MSSDRSKVISEVALSTISSETFNENKVINYMECTVNKTQRAKINWWNAPVQTILLAENTNVTVENAKDCKKHFVTTNESVLRVDNIKSKHYRNNFRDEAESAENFSQGSKLLVSVVTKPTVGVLNCQEEDDMVITGYRKSIYRSVLCWIFVLITFGLFRLILHWWQHLQLKATHYICPLEDADKVLIEENYQGKHKIYHVIKILFLDEEYARKQTSTQTTGGEDRTMRNTDNRFCYAMHFGSGQFKLISKARFFVFKQLRYAWEPQQQTFVQLKGLDELVPSDYFYTQRGLSSNEELARRLAYGQNEITVPYKSVKKLLFLEILNPFYIFQIFSVILWFTYSYYYYACVIILMSIFGITMSIRQTKKNQDVLRETVNSSGYAKVVNDKGDVVQKPTKDLVIGDIIEIPSSGCTLYCDAVLLSGNCILDESMLTGESVPVTKTPLPAKRDVIFSKKEHSRHTVFCGTKVIQTRSIESKQVYAIVINTGNITAKGGLIRSILFPPPVDYKFERDSYKFIECLGVVALIGFVYTLVTKILRGTDPIKIAVEALDLITIVVPPALPAAMTVGRFYAQKRLEKNGIYCISPRSINVAGSIDCCCFDKTGTLTEDGLDIWGIVPISETIQFQIPIKEIKRLPFDHFLYGMVTCHSITMMNGKMVGDPLDLKMFESTGWILEDSKEIPDMQKYNLIHPVIVRPPRKGAYTISGDGEFSTANQLSCRQPSLDDLFADAGLLSSECKNDHGVVREFPFSSNLQRMSVITRRLGERNFNVYCKGSPEIIQQLCKNTTIPENYAVQLAFYAKQGYRVIALGYKQLSPKVNYTKAQRLTRESVENNLEFLGFVIMENRLKQDTTEVIQTLNSANIKTVMVTGDNILTAVSVAHDCGIISKSDVVVTVNVKQRVNNQGDSALCYELYYSLEFGNDNKSCDITKQQNYVLCEDNSSLSTANYSLPLSNSITSIQTCDTWTHNDIEMVIDHSKHYDKWNNNYRFAMVGTTWEIVRNYFPELTPFFLIRGSVFARMSPDQKQALIVELQNLDYCVAMCGDGANDCGALKVAHTGISLSETESSIASPFTSKQPTIKCVPNVIKEGRAALVTSFGIFKYMAAYSMVQFVSVMILYSIDSNLTDKQYLYIDLGLISVFAFYFGKTEAYDGPLFKHPPLSSLISITPLSSIALHLIIVIIFQVTGWFHVRHAISFDYIRIANRDDLAGSHENYTMFAISSFQYIILAFVFSKSKPYRKALWSNISFCLSLLVNTCFVIYLILYPNDSVADFFQIIPPPKMGFRYFMLVYGCVGFIIHLLVESLIIERIILNKLQIPREVKVPTSKRKYIHIEYELKSLKNWPQITEYICSDSGQCELEPEPKYANLKAQQKFEIPKDNAFSNFFEIMQKH